MNCTDRSQILVLFQVEKRPFEIHPRNEGLRPRAISSWLVRESQVGVLERKRLATLGVHLQYVLHLIELSSLPAISS